MEQVGLTRNNLLLINATIIAGLLILFTVQSVVTDSVFDLFYTNNLLMAEDRVLGNLREQVHEAKKSYENVDEEGNYIIEAEPTGNPGEASFSLPLPIPLLEKQELHISEMSDENFKERVKLQAKIDSLKDLHFILILHSNPQLIVSMLILPFVGSMIIELIPVFKNKITLRPRRASIGFLIGGLIIMAIIFTIYLIITLVALD